GSGGRHIYFAQPTIPLRNSAGRIGRGIDVRGEGGYVLLPPSAHISGGTYLDDLMHPLFETPLATMPAWLVRLAAAGATTHGQVRTRSADGWAAKLPGAPEGPRRAEALEIPAHFLGKALPPAEVTEILLGFAARCTPPFSEHEARDIVRDLARKDQAKARTR